MKKETVRTVYFEGWGDVHVELGSENVRGVFTNWSCGALAKALNYLTGCKMIQSDGHAAVITFDGRVLDIKGVHTPTKFELEWGTTEPCDMNDLIDYGVDQWRKAIPFAELLAKKYLHQ